MPKPTCKQLNDFILSFERLKGNFDRHMSLEIKDISSLQQLRKEISQKTSEILSEVLSLEILTDDKIKEQYKALTEAYQAVGLIEILPDGQLGFVEKGKAYPFPSLEQVFSYIKNDFSFLKTLKQKENQGFEEIIITPFGMNLIRMVKIIEQKVIDQGGVGNFYAPDHTADWQDPSYLEYFTRLNENGQIVKGLSKHDIMSHPDTCPALINNGYLISIREKNLKIPYSSHQDESIGGRLRVKSERSVIDYLRMFKTAQYLGEDPMMPEEWLSLFAKTLYKNYLQKNKKIEPGDSHLVDKYFSCCFASTRFSSGVVPAIYWNASMPHICLDGHDKEFSAVGLGVRPVLRKKIKLKQK